MHGLKQCKFCVFQYDDSLPWTDDSEWDVLDIDDDAEWSFLQIQYRLKSRGIDCLQVLNWADGDSIVLIGIRAFRDVVAKALGVNEECIEEDGEIGIMVVNLFKEKYLRGDLDEESVAYGNAHILPMKKGD